MSRESLLVLFHYFGFFPSYDLGYFSCLTRSLVNALAPRTYNVLISTKATYLLNYETIGIGVFYNKLSDFSRDLFRCTIAHLFGFFYDYN